MNSKTSVTVDTFMFNLSPKMSYFTNQYVNNYYTRNVTDLKRFHDAVLDNNEDVAKRLIDASLGPDDTLEVCTCPNSCHGYTLLYMACVYDRLTIVKMLLEAGADPDGRNGNSSYWTSNYQTPFVYAIKQRNQELVRMLLRESKVHPSLQIHSFASSFPQHSVPYGMFREFAEDEDVIKAIMDNESPFEDIPTYTVINLLHGAAKHRSSKLCKFLVDHFGIKNTVDEVLEVDDRAESTETVSYMIEVYGARKFVEDKDLKEMIMLNGSTGMLELLMGHFYQSYGDSKEWWTEQMVTSWARRFPSYLSYMHDYIENALEISEVGHGKFECLLRWGMYSVLPDLPTPLPTGSGVRVETLFYLLAEARAIKKVRVLVSLYPQCLQEEWLRMGCKPMNVSPLYDEVEEVEEYFATLMEKRRHAPLLQMLCRSVIFHNLGINPIPKAERLPLPRKLKDFVQAKELFETND